MDQYIIVEARSPSVLQRRVNMKITEGYVPWGDLCVHQSTVSSPLTHSGTSEATKLYQTMILRNKYEC